MPFTQVRQEVASPAATSPGSGRPSAREPYRSTAERVDAVAEDAHARFARVAVEVLIVFPSPQ